MAWHFDYEDGSFLFIDENNEIYKIELTTEYNTTDDGIERLSNISIALINGTYESNFKFNHLVGFDKYRLFSNNNTALTGGRVVLYYDETIVQAWEGGMFNYIGEHLWIGNDSR